MKYFISLISLLIILGCSETPNDIPMGSYPGVEAIVFFSVHMSHQIELGNFDPDSDFLDIAGDFNEWDGTNDHLIAAGDDVYEISFTNFEVGEVIEFKFRINGAWDDLTEFPGAGPNRSYTVKQGENILVYWYDDADGS